MRYLLDTNILSNIMLVTDNEKDFAGIEIVHALRATE